jgi:ribosomal protein S18 acetylase RimI-like enzyme
MANDKIEIKDYSEEWSDFFSFSNLAWIKKYFIVEPEDEEILFNPKKYVIDNGGFIFFAFIDNEIAGTVALIKCPEYEEEEVYELSKMAVSEKHQGKKVGNRLIQHCLEKARELKADKVILHTNKILEAAIHLYEKFGFKQVPLSNSLYKRTNIKMEVDINKKA